MRPESEGVIHKRSTPDFMQSLMDFQNAFEISIVATDGTLRERNTPVYITDRGIVGEMRELREALQEGDLDAAKMEAIDVLIFTASLFNHLGMTGTEVERLALQKMSTNFLKYPGHLFTDKTVDEGMAYCKETWNDRKHLYPFYKEDKDKEPM